MNESLFSTRAQDAFSFLEEFGFRLASTVSPFVVYESSALRVRIYFDGENRDSGPDVSLERIDQDPRQWPPYGLSEFRAIAGEGGPRVAPVAAKVVRGERVLALGLQRLARELRTCAEPTLAGDRSQLDRIDLLRAEFGMTRGQWGKPPPT